MNKEFRVRNSWVIIGVGKFFGLGFYIDRWHITIDLFFIYLSIEY